MVAANGIPDIHLYLFISNGYGLSMDNWGEILSAYVEVAGREYMQLDVGHYVYSEAADVIATETRAFIERIRNP